MQPKTAELMDFFNKNVGPYPYKQYSVIQGGDGGMEYAMCTLITGERSYGSLVGVTAHEMAHSWFQHVLATNESKHGWMDEGFTSYISDLAMAKVLPSKDEKIHSIQPIPTISIWLKPEESNHRPLMVTDLKKIWCMEYLLIAKENYS